MRGCARRAEGSCTLVGLAVAAAAMAVSASPDRVGAQASAVLDVFPESSITTLGGDWTGTVTTERSPSGSTWAAGNREELVYLALLRHVQRVDGARVDARSAEVRIGRGGQIYSIRGAFGEALAPQWRSPDNPRGLEAPWVDEVFQVVAMSTRAHTPSDHFMIHQAGMYVIRGALDDPFYSPLLASGVGADGLSFSTLVWAQLARFPTEHPRPLLVWQRVRDVGAGVIEVAHVLYNFGDYDPDRFDDPARFSPEELADELRLDRFNLPWSGVRITSLGAHFICCDDAGGLEERGGAFADGLSVRFSDTHGWIAWAAGAAPTSPALGLVFGRDIHLGSDFQAGESTWRWGAAEETSGLDETEWRNLMIGTAIRPLVVPPGTALAHRHYLVVGSLAAMERLVTDHDLVTHVDYGPVRFAAAESPRLGWVLDAAAPGLRPAGDDAELWTYAHPVEGSFPLFVIQDTRTGAEHVTTNPQALSWEVHDGVTAFTGFAGFALPAERAGLDHRCRVAPLADVLAPAEGYYVEAVRGLVVCVAPAEAAREVCDDAIDNDGDGLIDYADPQCTCESADVCDDSDPCTRETCSSGMCMWTPDPTCRGDGGLAAPSAGCGCRVTGSGAPAGVLPLLGLVLLGLARQGATERGPKISSRAEDGPRLAPRSRGSVLIGPSGSRARPARAR